MNVAASPKRGPFKAPQTVIQFARMLENPEHRTLLGSILLFLTGLMALFALFESENTFFPHHRSLGKAEGGKTS